MGIQTRQKLWKAGAMLDAKPGAKRSSIYAVSKLGFCNICFLRFVVRELEASVVPVMAEAPL